MMLVSKLCAGWLMALIKKYCIVCGRSFYVSDPPTVGNPQKYCNLSSNDDYVYSNACAVKAHRQRRKKRLMESKNGK